MSGSIVPASSVQVKTMADGTLRLSLDIEPRHAQAAFVLFGSPGTPMALAALKVGTQIDPEHEPEPEPEPSTDPAKGGPLARWAAMRCKDAQFLGFFCAANEQEMVIRIKEACGIASRAELDSNAAAAGHFRRHFMTPWKDYCAANGQFI